MATLTYAEKGENAYKRVFFIIIFFLDELVFLELGHKLVFSATIELKI